MYPATRPVATAVEAEVPTAYHCWPLKEIRLVPGAARSRKLHDWRTAPVARDPLPSPRLLPNPNKPQERMPSLPVHCRRQQKTRFSLNGIFDDIAQKRTVALAAEAKINDVGRRY